jgi:hypothetical protein
VGPGPARRDYPGRDVRPLSISERAIAARGQVPDPPEAPRPARATGGARERHRRDWAQPPDRRAGPPGHAIHPEASGRRLDGPPWGARRGA